jgi:hypothetical protein
MKKFVVSSPSWFPSSGGITILHKFVHVMNELGYDTYMAPSNASGLGWHPSHIQFVSPSNYDKVKFITEEVYFNLEDAIVIYPETWYGNYLNAPNVVRWIMGAANPSYMGAGSMYGMNYTAWSDNDLWFWYSPMYITSTFNSFNKNLDNILNLVEFNRDIFVNRDEERTINCWTLRKSAGRVDQSDYIHEIDAIFFGDIDKSLPNPDYDFPGQYKKLADLFNKTNKFYSYDPYTFISVQAAMCGADSIVFPRKGLSKEEYYNGSELHRYIAYGIDELEKSRSVRGELNDHIDDIQKMNIESIHTFVEKCHDYFK